MIKICSLDFINKKTFEADVMSADGTVLIKSGEPITPNLILRLYYLDIYVEQPLSDSDAEEIQAEVIESSVESFAPGEESVSVLMDKSTGNVTSVGVDIEQVAETDFAKASASFAGAEAGAAVGAENRGPRSADASSALGSGVAGEEEKGPRFADSTSRNSVDIEENKKGPRFADANELNMVGADMPSPAAAIVEPVVEAVPEIDPEDVQLEFDEDEAQRIVQNSVKLGKMLGYTAKDLKELEQVSYYINIGISKFKKRDTRKKSFRKMKILASYEKLINEGMVSNDVADVVKYCINPYDSETFMLNSKIPYHHIVSITSYYEDMLVQNGSKQSTLRKMLQLGGNNFNIFILHKFINMMRGLDE